MDHIATSPPQLRTLQPAALHTFQHPQDDRGAAHAFAAAAAASGTYAVNPDDSGVLFQQPAFLTAVPDRAIRSQRDQLPPALSGLQSQHISPHQSNAALFHFGSPQDPHFAAPHVQIQPPSEAQDAAKSDGKIEGLKLVLDPPNLDQWRQRLFDVDQTIVMTEDQYVPRTECPVQPSDACQIPDVLAARRQHLLAPLNPEIQAQALRLALLGLPLEGSSSRHSQVGRSQQEKA